jgi:hypothetical protein
MCQQIDLLKARCNRYVNGQCTTSACMRRGGWKPTGEPTDYAYATCAEHETVQIIERARDLVSCLVKNDPNDYAADAVTVLDVWRKDAEIFLAETV